MDKKTERLPLVATPPEREDFKDYLHRLNKTRREAGEKPYSFSRYGIEAIKEKMTREPA